MDVLFYRGYFTNGYYFYTKAYDYRCTVQNSGVTLVGQSMHIFVPKTINPTYKDDILWVIEDTWELDYIMFRVFVFRCKWVENNNGIKINELGFILVELNKEDHKEDSFILASEAK